MRPPQSALYQACGAAERQALLKLVAFKARLQMDVQQLVALMAAGRRRSTPLVGEEAEQHARRLAKVRGRAKGSHFNVSFMFCESADEVG